LLLSMLRPARLRRRVIINDNVMLPIKQREIRRREIKFEKILGVHGTITPMKISHKIIIGDSRNMQELSTGSIQLVVTSPPYWQLKDYGSDEQIGFHHTYEDYINHLNLVWNECYRVLENGCRLCVNIGDQFARAVYYGRYKVIPIRTEIIKFCESVGFDYMGSIIWQKVTTCNTTGGAAVMGSYPYPRNGIIKIDYEFILVFKKQGQASPVTKDVKEASRLTEEEWNQFFNGHWNFPGERQSGHLAMFPEELPRRLIKMFTFVGDTVLDPFLGSGTTSLAAKKLSRNSVGYEINKEFLPVIQNKIGSMHKSLFEETQFAVCEQEVKSIDFSERIEKLPYIFKDPLQFNKKIDVKKLQFGSRLDKNIVHREEYFTVKKIISSEKVELDNGLQVRLLGIREDSHLNGKAVRFLEDTIKGKKVFIKYDNVKYDSNNNLLGYLYLKNKTFINMHLLKNRLASADTEMDYKYKIKFTTLPGI